jgi:hypothetical protein
VIVFCARLMVDSGLMVELGLCYLSIGVKYYYIMSKIYFSANFILQIDRIGYNEQVI